MKSSSTPVAPPSWPCRRRKVRVAKAHSCIARPPTPIGCSSDCPGPAPKPSSEIAKLQTRSFGISVLLGQRPSCTQCSQRRLIDHAPRRQPATCRHQQRPTADTNRPNRGLEGVTQLEPARSEKVRSYRGTERGDQPRETPEGRELREHPLQHGAAARAECAQHGALVAPLVAARLH